MFANNHAKSIQTRGTPAFRSGLDAAGGLSGCCYRKLSRLVPGLGNLVSFAPGHSRVSHARSGARLTLLLLAVGDCGSSVDLSLIRECAASARARDARVEMELRAHCLDGFGCVEVLALSRGRTWLRAHELYLGRPECREAANEALTRFLFHWLARLLAEGHCLPAGVLQAGDEHPPQAAHHPRHPSTRLNRS